MGEMLYLSDLYRAKQLREASEFLISRNRGVVKQKDLSKFPARVVMDIVSILC